MRDGMSRFPLLVIVVLSLYVYSSYGVDLEGTTFRSDTGAALGGVLVTLDGEGTTLSHTNGSFRFENTTTGNHTLSCSMASFWPYSKELQISDQMTAAGTDLPLVPVLDPTTTQPQYTLMVNWNAPPNDLDVHFVTPWGCRVFYDNVQCQNGSTVAKMTREDLDGFGPEVITVESTQSDTLECGEYLFWVYIYSSDGTYADARANVELYEGHVGFLETAMAPLDSNQENNWWLAFNISVVSGSPPQFVATQQMALTPVFPQTSTQGCKKSGSPHLPLSMLAILQLIWLVMMA